MDNTPNRRKKLQTEIEDLLSGQMRKEIKENPSFFSELPPNVQATLASRLIPAAKPVDADLEREALSLAEILASLPPVGDAMKAMAIQTVTLKTLRYRVETLEKQLEIALTSHIGEDAIISLVNDLEEVNSRFYRDMRNGRLYAKDIGGLREFKEKYAEIREKRDEPRREREVAERGKDASD